MNDERISFWAAWFLPKVLFYASAYFCAKFALYVVFFSLFEFLNYLGLESQQQANVSTMNDIGGFLGSISMGYLSDLTYGKRSPVALFGIIMTCVIFYSLFIRYDYITYPSLMVAFLFYGFFMQGVANTLVATCSADIGKGSGKHTKAVATVTGIIDGSGSVGASIGQFVVGSTETKYGWRYGYLLLVSIMQTITILPLAKIFIGEV